MALDIEISKSPHQSVGRSDTWLEQAKQKAEQSPEIDVVIDLTGIERINSHELNKLIRLQLHVKQCGRRLVLVNVQETVFQVFTLTRLDRLIELHHDGHFEPPAAKMLRPRR
ncbi:hypothetical protein Poly51_15690 [Rubripirellula tenax]|uniref:STAS domain-containing protein n=1 Tax=Rubripirellula tenax TaxID=2528015 RepID=A0A5C6FGJ3_9BACT|nr:STAS domain-containing protein [Rubripirellula tenax]TWU58789.1 hypothetical protein Poly51_15690 [Rubripirellula tenax]